MTENLFPPLFPTAWACEFGEDNHGLWMAFSCQGVKQVMRWIQPDTFMMGSPEDEKGRFDWEDLHQVTLTNGFWLADTTVTQALWQAVMEDNPSHFKGDNLPVEQVSWDEAQKFIERLNALFNGERDSHVFRLPSEAEWEYACRGGRKTAFNFDGDLSVEKVNYRGIWEWKTSKDWGKGALKKTAKVKSYPCNDWGLYEMHGNVWEWCQDGWQEKLGKQSVTNPVQPVNNAGRVVRGGSWFDLGQFARSAYRGRRGTAYRDYDLGLRLSLGLQAKQAQVK